jgi:hypothetical protein
MILTASFTTRLWNYCRRCMKLQRDKRGRPTVYGAPIGGLVIYAGDTILPRDSADIGPLRDDEYILQRYVPMDGYAIWRDVPAVWTIKFLFEYHRNGDDFWIIDQYGDKDRISKDLIILKLHEHLWMNDSTRI